MMAETSLGSTTSPLISTSAVAGNPGWNLAPQNLGVAPASSPTIFAMTHPTAEETAALTAMAAEAAAEAAAGAAGDQETMEYVEVLLELPPMPPQALAYTEPEPEDVKPQASHLRLALENYDKQPQWDNYNYPPATNVSKSVAGLNPLFNPSGHNSRTETVVVVGCSTSPGYASLHDSNEPGHSGSCGDIGSVDIEPIDESLFYRNNKPKKGRSARVKKERVASVSSSLDVHVVESTLNNSDGCESIDMMPTAKLTMKKEYQENQHVPCGQCNKTFYSEHNRRSHIKTVHEKAKAFVCEEPGCNFRASRLSNLKGHENAIHKKEQFYHCPFCLTHKSRTNYFTKHLKDKHSDELVRLGVTAEMVRYVVGYIYRKDHNLASAKKPKNFDEREMDVILAFLGTNPDYKPLWVGEVAPSP